jgi:ankyrin repeat protein
VFWLLRRDNDAGRPYARAAPARRAIAERGEEVNVLRERALPALAAMLAIGLAACGQPTIPRDTHRMAREGQLDLLQAAIEENPEFVHAKATDGETPLHKAAGNNQTAVVEFLLANGARVDAQDNDGETPLRDAAKAGYTDVMELLIANGADLNARDADGDTPLHLAVKYGQENAVELLLAKGAIIDVENNDGDTPAELAVEEGETEIAERLAR